MLGLRSEVCGPALWAILFFRSRIMTSAVKPVSIQTLVEGLRRLPESSFGPTEPIRRFLQETPVSADSLAPYLNWDRQHYTRNLIDRTPLYELMAICWAGGQASSVHNHRDQ